MDSIDERRNITRKKILKVGEVVSTPEGTRMTVRSVDGKKITCNWFVGAKLYQDEFNVDELTFLN